MSEWYRTAFGELYPLVYPHRGVAEAARVVSRLSPLLHAPGPTLDVACGNGRYLEALRSAGIDGYGVDLSEYLLGEGARAGLGGRLVCGDMRALPFAAGAFGSAINMFTSFGYFGDDGDNARALREMARVVAPRGAFVLDFIHAGRIQERFEPHSERAAGDARVVERRELTGDGRVLIKRVEVSRPGRETVAYAERLRLYTHPELARMLADAGFEVRRTHGDYELGPFDERASERVIFVCEKRPAGA